MAQRPFGVTILGCFFVFIGGLSSLIVFIQILDSIGRYGLDSIFVESMVSFKGFYIFGVLPVLVYSLGIGMLLMRPWARRVAIYVIPLSTLFFFGMEDRFVFILFLSCLLLVYFNRKEIKREFALDDGSEENINR